MPGNDNLLNLARRRITEFSEEERRLQRKLTAYGIFSDVAVAAGIVIPLLAGSTLVVETGALSGYKNVVAVLVFGAAVLTALHKGLNCEAYHAECRRAIHLLRGLVEGYEAMVALESAQLQPALADLEARRQQYRDRAFDVPPRLSVWSVGPVTSSAGNRTAEEGER